MPTPETKYKICGIKPQHGCIGKQPIIVTKCFGFLLHFNVAENPMNSEIYQFVPDTLCSLSIANAWFYYIVLILSGFIIIYLINQYIRGKIENKYKTLADELEKQTKSELSLARIRFIEYLTGQIRGPLSLIIAPLDMLQKNRGNDAELNIIRHNVINLNQILDQLDDYRKHEADETALNKELTNIVDYIKQKVFYFQGLVTGKNIEILLKPSLENCYVDLDKSKFNSALDNSILYLINNLSEGGAINIRMSLQKTDNNFHYSSFVMMISSSRGLHNESEILNIVSLFSNEESVDRFDPGSDLGLNIARQLIENHGGRFSARQNLNSGIDLVFKLPVLFNGSGEEKVNLLNQDRNEVTTDKLSPNKKTIIVVDDNVQICNYLEEILIDDYNIIKETDGRKAFDIVLNYMPDLILCDIMMPQISGIEVCKMIKSDIRICHIPVIFLTAKSSVEDHIIGYETGADDYLFKPFNNKLLQTRIKNLIRQREQLRAHFIGNDGKLNQEAVTTTLDKTFINKVFQVIRDNYNNPDFTVNEIVEKIGMSRSVFYKKFKALSAQPINDVIKDFRLNRAKEMLSGNKLSVSEIAYNTGFSDPAYFSKVFKETFNESPKTFASKNLNQ